jgi:hypothetical protein
VQAEAALDGIYIVRTSVPKEAIDTDDAVRHYKSLTRVEKTFRMMKMSGLEVRPIFHRTEDCSASTTRTPQRQLHFPMRLLLALGLVSGFC